MEHYALILEDNPAFAAFVNKSLEQAGFQVHHAANHDDLNMLMNEREYDVAIFDLSTGGEKDGVQCITCLKKWDNYWNRTTPLIMLTGIDNLKAREHALKTGAQEFMSKDEVKKEEIYSNVRKVILEYKPDRLPPALGDNA